MRFTRLIRTASFQGVMSALLIASGLSFITSEAHAQGADIARMSCGNFEQMRPMDREQLGLWLYGYYAGSAQKTVVDRTAFNDAFRALNEACAKQKNAPLIGADVRAIFLPQSTNNDASVNNGDGRSVPVGSNNRNEPQTTGSLPIRNGAPSVTPNTMKPAPR